MVTYIFPPRSMYTTLFKYSSYFIVLVVVKNGAVSNSWFLYIKNQNWKLLYLMGINSHPKEQL